jgi:hypothetical protein
MFIAFATLINHYIAIKDYAFTIRSHQVVNMQENNNFLPVSTNNHDNNFFSPFKMLKYKISLKSTINKKKKASFPTTWTI